MRRLTKKLEGEILKLYHAYWDAYLAGDFKAFASYLDENTTVFGTAQGEVFTSRQETVKFYKATADQMTGKADFRKRKISASAVGDTIMVNEQSDLYVLVDGAWVFYGHSRITAIFEQKGNSWKLVHQHASFPDTRAEEGEQVATKKIQKENIELREAVKRRTVELEEKNRELEIETALEKVRAVALGMKKAEDMLSICKTISQQLAKLGVKEIRNVQTAIFNVPAGTYMNYEFYAKHDKTFITETLYTNHKVARAFAAKMLKGKGEVSVTHIKGKEKVKEWLSYQKGTNVFIDTWLNTATSLSYYWFSLGPVALGISTYCPLSNEELQLFQRFLKVFELAYRRYLDIEKAVAQAREAQIEAALERIRARALAMHSSDEFTDVARVMREQMGQLGQQEMETSAVHLYDEDAEYILSWRAFRLSSDLKSKINYGFFKIPKNSCKIAREFMQKFKSKAADYTIEISGARQTEWYKILFKLAPEVEAAMKKSGTTKEKRYYHFSKFSGGSLLMVSSKEPSNDAIELQKRAAQVFDLAYSRFKDLQKAEAQAREAQVEAALERIRAASLAMQDSSALGEIIYKLYGELTKLDAKLDRCFIMIVNPYNKGITWWMAGHEGLLAENGFFVPMNQHPSHLMYLDYCKKRKKKWTYLFEGKEKRDWDRFGFSKTELAKLPEPIKAFMAAAKKVHLSGSSDQFGSLVTGSFEPLPEEQQEIISRFAIAFNQAYIRFLDLQKAEAQAREAKIEAALERVRSRSLAMHHSSELSAVVDTLLTEFTNLEFALTFCIINLIDEQDRSNTVWAANPETGKAPESYYMKFEDYPFHHAMWDAWKAQKKNFIYTIEGKEKKIYDEYLYTKTEFRRFPKHVQEANKALKRYVAGFTFFKYSGLQTVSENHISAEDLNILERFGRVFEQCYTRFLDLQKAEAQAREAQIEASLEKVRSRSMAMQQPEELVEVAELLRREMGQLGVEELETSSIYLVDKERKQAECWYAIKDVREKDTRLVSDEMPLLLTDTWVGKQMWKFFLSAEERISILMKGERRREWINYCAQHSKVLQGYYGEEIPDRTYHLVKFNGGYIGAAAPGDISAESWDLLKRVSTVFSLAYTRFKDLQDAAARAREAQIELALERVRSRSMAMHKSEELKEVIRLVLDQFIHLNINAEHAGFYIDYKAHDDMHIWLADPNIEPFYATLPYFDTPTWNSFLDAKAKGKIFFTDLLSFEEKNKFYQSLFKIFEVPEDAKKFYMECKGLAVSTVLLDNVGLYIENFQGIPYTEEENKILMRFGKVFQQTYTRFLDLQKAEAQARESQIEAALERVRSRSMAMHDSKELGEVAKVMFNQMKLLGGELFAFGIVLCDKDENVVEQWHGLGEGDMMTPFQVPVDLDYIHRYRYDQWKAGVELFSIEIPSDYIARHFELMFALPSVKMVMDDLKSKGIELAHPSWEIDYGASFRYGYLLVSSLQPYAEEKIFPRFAKVFEQAYTRFLDLQKAEAQTREAQIEAALEKVRSRTLAMQKSDELAGTAAVLFQQLISLGIEPNRLYIILIKENTADMEAWVTDEDGSKVSMGFTGNYRKNETLLKMYEGWRANKGSLVIDMQGEELQQYFHYLHDELNVPFKGGLEQKRRVQHIAYFSHGLIGMASPEEQPAATMQLLERFAAVFNLTFTRFNDLQIAEAHARQAELDLIAIKEAKQKAEEALTELQATQKQLIQSEKMASLGELTAGIAHEIQNPLNFVNNFSEVSKELLDEMKEEMEKGNMDEAREIMNDVIQNLEKINHHGKRADGIVKGMLQHSRSSSGQKELTDINALCDEYLRLAYHGLRAKDKSFNAKFETELDASIGKINILPQDLGRVVLNLINNAFYAVSERKKAGDPGYEPTVIVSTKKENGNIIISVRDNGTGIPMKVLDKIFQPFFTTKPTGQGTGLGLSLSYDIITKGHAGELKVETKEGEGTVFIIQLPA